MSLSFKDALLQNIDNASAEFGDVGPIARSIESVMSTCKERKVAGVSLMRRGENGCVEFTDEGIGDRVLAISQLVRGGDARSLFRRILRTDDTQEVVRAITLIFTTRNSRGGKGEKDLSFDMFLELVNHRVYAETATALLPLFVHFGYWKDLFLLLASELRDKGYEPKQSKKRKRAGNSSQNGSRKAKNDAISASSFLLKPIIDLIREQWDKDIMALSKYKKQMEELKEQDRCGEEFRTLKAKGPLISLLAKWLPREDSDLDRRTGFVKYFANELFTTVDGAAAGINKSTVSGQAWRSTALSCYRKQLAELTAFLYLPEVLLAAQRADEIEFGRVASKATLKLTNAFLNHKNVQDPKRQICAENFLQHMTRKGLKGGQVMPHEIVKIILNHGSISEGLERGLDLQWKDLWSKLWQNAEECRTEEGAPIMVPICDVSGSMSGTPMEVAIAMSIGIAEKNSDHPAFANKILTFHSDPKWVTIDPNASIVQKVRHLSKAPWGFNTDFAKAFNRLLKRCIELKLPRSQLPSIIIFSDMQFDQACTCSQQTMWTTIQAKVKQAGRTIGWSDKDLDPPPMIFWNLRNTGGHPVKKDERGTVLLAGYSPSLLKSVVNGDVLEEIETEVVDTAADGTVTTRTEKVRVTPHEVLEKILNDPMYDVVRQVLGESTDGALKEYECLVEAPFQLVMGAEAIVNGQDNGPQEENEFEMI